MSARLGAAELLDAVLDRGRSLDAALVSSAAFTRLEGRDRAFARAIAGAALRRLGGLDAVLARFLDRPLPAEAREARAILRAGAAELLVLGSAPHAAVSEAVDAARRAAPRFAGLINAVLRKVAADGPALLAAGAPGVDLPDWIYARWRAAYGDGQAAEIAQALTLQPPLDLTVKSDPARWAERLGGVTTPSGSVRLPHGHPPVQELDGYAEGAWWVQDAAAALPALLLGDIRGLDALDLCAAPGGKTLQLAAAGARVTALDIDAGRLERVRENLDRTGLDAALVAADALNWAPSALFDVVLLDAPCTATGTLRRRPDAAWLRRPTDIAELSALQARLLKAAGQFLKPGGRLVYAVCSIEPEEGPAVAALASSLGLSAIPLSASEFPNLSEHLTPDGALRTLPSHLGAIGGMDGFYAARFTRMG